MSGRLAGRVALSYITVNVKNTHKIALMFPLWLTTRVKKTHVKSFVLYIFSNVSQSTWNLDLSGTLNICRINILKNWISWFVAPKFCQKNSVGKLFFKCFCSAILWAALGQCTTSQGNVITQNSVFFTMPPSVNFCNITMFLHEPNATSGACFQICVLCLNIDVST